MIGLGVIALYVPHRPTREDARTEELGKAAVTLREAIKLVGAPGFRPFLIVGAALRFATISDGFLYLTLQRRLDFHVGFFPLLFVATAFVYELLALPMRRLADRFGRVRVIIGGDFFLGFARLWQVVWGP